MNELNITKLIDDAVLEFGNKRFVEGWFGSEERIIKLLEDLAKSTFPGDVCHVNPFEYAIALIKGENK